MKSIAFLLMAVFLLGGCTSNPSDGEPASGAPPVDGPPAEPLVIDVVVPDSPVKGMASFTVTTAREAMVAVVVVPRIDYVGDHRPVNGTEVFDLVLEPGMVRVAVDAFSVDEDDEGRFHDEYDLQVLAESIIIIEYGSTSDKEAVNDTVWVDITTFASKAHYEAKGAKHPEFVNVHDVLSTWEGQEGHVIEYAYNPSVQGFSVSRIDGEGNAIDAEDGAVGSRDPPYWCYTINDDSSVQGITAQRFTPGDVIYWELGSCGSFGLTA